MRAGDEETAALLVGRGAADDSTDVDRFIGACLAGDRHRAEHLLADHPELREQITEEDWSVIVDAAGSRPAETISLLLDLGFSPHARNGFGEQPLHNAAYHGNVAVVQVAPRRRSRGRRPRRPLRSDATGLRHRRQRRAGRQAR